MRLPRDSPQGANPKVRHRWFLGCPISGTYRSLFVFVFFLVHMATLTDDDAYADSDNRGNAHADTDTISDAASSPCKAVRPFSWSWDSDLFRG